MTEPTDAAQLSPPIPRGEEDVTASGADGHRAPAGVAASASEAAAFRGPDPLGGERLSQETRRLEDRDTYGMAFLQVCNLWRKDEDVARFVLAVTVRRCGRRPAGGGAGAALPRPGAVQGARRWLHPVAPGRDVLAAGRSAVPHDVDAAGGHHPGEGWARLRQRQPRRRSPERRRTSPTPPRSTSPGCSPTAPYPLAEPVAMRAGDASFHYGLDGAQGPAQRVGDDARGHDRHLVRRRAHRAAARQPGPAGRPRGLAARPRPG